VRPPWGCRGCMTVASFHHTLPRSSRSWSLFSLGKQCFCAAANPHETPFCLFRRSRSVEPARVTPPMARHPQVDGKCSSNPPSERLAKPAWKLNQAGGSIGSPSPHAGPPRPLRASPRQGGAPALSLLQASTPISCSERLVVSALRPL